METGKMTSLTKNTYKNPSPVKTNAKQAKADGKFSKISEAIETSKSSHAPKTKMSIGMTTDMHGKALGGHPKHRASEFEGLGKGHMTDCGK